MIRGFADRETEKVFNREHSRRLPVEMQRTALRKLLQIASTNNLNTLRVPPNNRLEKLRGERAGQYSIRINDQWRICFTWDDGYADDVEITDYH